MGNAELGTRRTNNERHNAERHRQTDKQTDKRQYLGMNLSYCMQHDQPKNRITMSEKLA